MPQKVLAGGNVPQKVFDAETTHAHVQNAVAAVEQKYAMKIMQLEQVVMRLMQANAGAEKRNSGLSVMEITVIVLALVFIVLVLFLISSVRRLSGAL